MSQSQPGRCAGVRGPTPGPAPDAAVTPPPFARRPCGKRGNWVRDGRTLSSHVTIQPPRSRGILEMGCGCGLPWASSWDSCQLHHPGEGTQEGSWQGGRSFRGACPPPQGRALWGRHLYSGAREENGAHRAWLESEHVLKSVRPCPRTCLPSMPTTSTSPWNRLLTPSPRLPGSPLCAHHALRDLQARCTALSVEPQARHQDEGQPLGRKTGGRAHELPPGAGLLQVNPPLEGDENAL